MAERHQQDYIIEMVNHYHEIENKASKLIDKKKAAMEWLDNRYVYLIIVLSALIGAAKDKLDSFYDDFQENLIDLHHNQRTWCIERRKRIENIQKFAMKKRVLIQNVLKKGSPKKIRQITEKLKSKAAENSETLLSEFEQEEFIDYEFDSQDALKKICLAMITSTDVKLIPVPPKFSSADMFSAITTPHIEKKSSIENRISSAYVRDVENAMLHFKETSFHREVVVLDDSDYGDTDDDTDKDIDGDDDDEEVEDVDNDDDESGDSKNYNSGLENGITIKHESKKERPFMNQGRHVDADDIDECENPPSYALVSKERNSEDNCKITMDSLPNGYSRSTKYILPNGPATSSHLPSEHGKTKDSCNARHVQFNCTSDLDTSSNKGNKTPSPKPNSLREKIQYFEKHGIGPHVGVTLPVKTETAQNTKNGKPKKHCSSKGSNTCIVECSVEGKGNVQSKNFPLDIKPLPENLDAKEDDLLINGVLDTIELADATSDSESEERLQVPKGVIPTKVSTVRFREDEEVEPEKVLDRKLDGADDLTPIKISEVRLQGSRCHTGTFISDNRILFPDYVFEKLKIFDLRGNELNRFTLFRKPWDVACNSKGEIIVSFPNSMCFKKYRLTNNELTELDSIDMFSFGIDGFDDILGNQYLFVNEKSVNILESNGKLFRTIPTSCIDSKVVGSKNELKFYYTDGNDIVCETKWGKRVSTYSYPIIETPIALSLDVAGNLYVCCFNSGQISIYKISTNDKHFLIAKFSWEEPDLPRKIVFDHKGEHFFIISHIETPPNLSHTERSRELLVIQPQILEAGLAEIYKLPSKHVETTF